MDDNKDGWPLPEIAAAERNAGTADDGIAEPFAKMIVSFGQYVNRQGL